MYTEEQNIAFQNADRNEQKLMIAREVLLLLSLDKLVPMPGIYFDVTDEDIDNVEDEQFTDYFAPHDRKCTVCAVGSVAVGLYNITNHARVGDVQNNAGTHSSNRITKYFDEIELLTMEAAFEGYTNIGASFSLAKKCQVLHFYHKYSVTSERIVAIWNNIIENNGTFHPELENYDGIEPDYKSGDCNARN